MTSPDELIESFQERMTGVSLSKTVKVELTLWGESAVSLDYVRVEPAARGRGFATKMLKLLMEMCDAAEVIIFVIPTKIDDGESLNNQDLAAWYSRHDFVDAPTDDLPRQMQRHPRKLL